jgi:hypothetical protein
VEEVEVEVEVEAQVVAEVEAEVEAEAGAVAAHVEHVKRAGRRDELREGEAALAARAAAAQREAAEARHREQRGKHHRLRGVLQAAEALHLVQRQHGALPPGQLGAHLAHLRCLRLRRRGRQETAGRLLQRAGRTAHHGPCHSAQLSQPAVAACRLNGRRGDVR